MRLSEGMSMNIKSPNARGISANSLQVIRSQISRLCALTAITMNRHWRRRAI